MTLEYAMIYSGNWVAFTEAKQTAKGLVQVGFLKKPSRDYKGLHGIV